MKSYRLCLALLLLGCDSRRRLEPEPPAPASAAPVATTPAPHASTGKLPILGDPLGLLSRPPVQEAIVLPRSEPPKLGPGALMARPSDRAQPATTSQRDPRAVERAREAVTKRMPIESAEVHEATAARVFRGLRDSPGKLRVLYLYASYCPACRDVMPNVRAFAKKYYGRGVEFTAASVDKDRDAFAVYAASALEGVFPATLITSDGTTALELNRLGVPTEGKSFSIPLIAIVDRNNRVLRYGHTDMAARLERTIDPLLTD